MLVAIWLEAQVTSRLLDHTARWLRRAHGIGYYTIGSAGHESNAIVASTLRTSDPALLHYRSGGFFIARALLAQNVRTDATRDILRGLLAKATEPIAGGRHKVFGSHELSIIPQTSTIASHLPRAVGLALSFGLAPSAPTSWPEDSVVVCSFGDGSLNHSTAQGAINWACHARRSGARVPLLFVCEDNGLGLSVPTPDRWVGDSLSGRPELTVAHADGDNPTDVWRASTALVDNIRATGQPGVLHLSTVRFLGHAGTDVESAYRSPTELAADVTRDPILATARLAAQLGVSSPAETIDWYLDLRASIRDLAFDVLDEPELITAADIMTPLVDDAVARSALSGRTPAGDVPAAGEERLTVAQTINRVLGDELAASDDALVFGEDVGRKGGAYGVTRGLHKRFGENRVFDTLLDEQSILGLALGAGLNGRLPIPEIQYLAYLHNAEDQLRGEAATLAFFSKRQFLNPMVVRVAGYGYQKGFGGHFHNDNSIAVLRDIPGIVIASPGHPADAGPMLNACLAHARTTGAVCVFLEPIARYHTTDLHEVDDNGWTAPFDATPAPLGRARTHGGSAHDVVTIVTWANGLFLSLRAQRRLATQHGISVRVVDMRWIAPMPIDDVLIEANATGRVLIVDETRAQGGVAEGVIADLVDAKFDGMMQRVAARNSFVPLGAAAELVLVSEDDIMTAAIELAER